jgi:hypothetical protein
MMRLFKANESAKVLICVGCCYYKMKCRHREESTGLETNNAMETKNETHNNTNDELISTAPTPQNPSDAVFTQVLSSKAPSPMGGDTYCNFPLSRAVEQEESQLFDSATRFHSALMKIACDGLEEADTVWI